MTSGVTKRPQPTRHYGLALIRIEATDLPGIACGPGPDYPSGHNNVHVAVQGRKGQRDLLGLVRADAAEATWSLECFVLAPPPAADLRGPQIHGSPGHRFIYLSWGRSTGTGSGCFAGRSCGSMRSPSRYRPRGSRKGGWSAGSG